MIIYYLIEHKILKKYGKRTYSVVKGTFYFSKSKAVFPKVKSLDLFVSARDFKLVRKNKICSAF